MPYNSMELVVDSKELAEYQAHSMVSVIVKSKTEDIDVSAFLRMIVAAWTGKNKSQALTDRIGIETRDDSGEVVIASSTKKITVIPSIISSSEFAAVMSCNPLATVAEKKAALQAVTSSKLEFFVRRPCRCCGNQKIEVPVNWTIARDIINEYADVSKFSNIEGAEGVDTFLRNQLSFHGYMLQISELDRVSICAACKPKIKEAIFLQNKINEEIAETARKERELQQQRQEEQERLSAAEKAEERRKWNEENPMYLVMVGDLACIDEHNAKVNNKLANGYHVWGHPVSDNGRIAQTLVRADALKKRDEAKKVTGKHERSGSSKNEWQWRKNGAI